MLWPPNLVALFLAQFSWPRYKKRVAGVRRSQSITSIVVAFVFGFLLIFGFSFVVFMRARERHTALFRSSSFAFRRIRRISAFPSTD
jgi:hypothetical protein